VTSPIPVFSRLLKPSLAAVALVGVLAAGVLHAQQPGSSSSSSSSSSAPGQQNIQIPAQTARARAVHVEEGGAAVTLETSEELFDLAASLNACGYDADLDHSAPVRTEIRTDMQQALQASEIARTSRDALCLYITQHHLRDSGRDLGQYVSLALYLTPPPELTTSVDLTELPPDSAAVVNVLPLVRTFAEAVDLHAIWLHHRPEYDALLAAVHDPMTHMILNTNIYLHQPVSSYDGRRFLVLLEPMLAPALTNARIYASDYIVVTSPTGEATNSVRLDLIRHTYLHYVVEPMVYSRAAATDRLLPLLRPVQDAPLEFQYKSDIVALLTECLIKSIEARTYETATPKPVKPKTGTPRSAEEQYTAALAAFDHLTELKRQELVELDMRQGWVLTDYFFAQLQEMEHSGDGLRDEIGQMIYGMDVERERHHSEQIVFAKEGSTDILRGSPRQPHVLTDMDRAEMALMKGDRDTAEDLATKALADPKGDHGRAQYVLARINLMSGNADEAISAFEATLKTSTDPRTLAWSHIYLGRLYDSEREPERDKAIAQYKLALTVRDAQPDTRIAAEKGLKVPFTMPQRAQRPPVDEKDLDPTGKAQKDAYRPQPPR
jgi:tetratricopeptide (TPR) repeat protein